MRLIDADKLKGKCICSRTYCGVNKLAEIDSIPTSYDVDRVCRKINENKDMDNLIDADFATKIVKSGGIE